MAGELPTGLERTFVLGPSSKFSVPTGKVTVRAALHRIYLRRPNWRFCLTAKTLVLDEKVIARVVSAVKYAFTDTVGKVAASVALPGYKFTKAFKRKIPLSSLELIHEPEVKGA